MQYVKRTIRVSNSRLYEAELIIEKDDAPMDFAHLGAQEALHAMGCRIAERGESTPR